MNKKWMLWIIRLTSTKKQKLPSAYFSHGKSPFLKRKPSINGPFSMKFTGLTAPLLPRSGAPKPHQRQGLHHPGAVACWQLYKNIRYNVQVCIYIYIYIYCFLFILTIYTYIYIYKLLLLYTYIWDAAHSTTFVFFRCWDRLRFFYPPSLESIQP